MNMSSRFLQVSCLSVGLLSLIAAAPAPEPSIHIGGNVAPGTDWTIHQIETQLPQEIRRVEYTDKEGKHSYSCVSLDSLLKQAGVAKEFIMQPGEDPKVKHPQLRRIVVVTGKDGYAVVFSLGEIMPAIGNHPVWVALEEDGKRLPDLESPARLVLPDDKIAARSVHALNEIDVVQLDLSTLPKNP
jgi:hypothetical protein